VTGKYPSPFAITVHALGVMTPVRRAKRKPPISSLVRQFDRAIQIVMKKHILQIRNGIYFLCLITVIGWIVGIWLNIHLTNQSFAKMESLMEPVSAEQKLMNELNGLLEANKIESLVARCKEVLAVKPMNRAAHYYLGLAYYQSGDAGNCRKHLEEALRIDPTWKPAIEPYLKNL
jgi:tetratricopeptide (TPR) repeat protein